MHANDIGDIIARFIGSFEIATDADRLRQSYEDFLAARAAREHVLKDGATHAAKGPGLATGGEHDPNIDIAPDHFRIEHVRSHPVHASDIEIEIPALGRLHQTHHAHHARLHDGVDAGDGGTFGFALHTRLGFHREIVRPDGDVDYRDEMGSSLIAIGQDGTLLDDDIFSAVDGLLPPAASSSVATELAVLTEQADAWSRMPDATNDIAALKEMLTVSEPGDAPAQADEVEPGEGLAEHAGLYVDGQAVESAPDLVEILKARFEAEPPEPGTGEGPGAATVSLGGNLLLNQTVLIEAATYGHTSVVFGDWHETNVIRQLNIVADTDAVFAKGVDAFTKSDDQTVNAAYFERLDTASGAPASTPLFAFPLSYTVDVVEGDLLVSNFIRQIHKVSDNDGALFTSIDHSASIVMGGNEVLHFASLSQLTLGYDLVIFGGSVFEGNFIEQINLLLDHDRIDGDFPGGTSGETGGNLLYNKASILTIGANDGFEDIDPAIRDLVDHFDAGDRTIPVSLSADLSFLGATHLKVLYITGDYVEINAISQLNILSDADNASYVDGLIGELTSDEAVWTVSTGGNILVNDATILDADAAGPRQLGGEYYSDSILIQADLVADGDGIQVFDTGKLANELVAFTSHDASESHDDATHHPTGTAYDAPTDGVGSILI